MLVAGLALAADRLAAMGTASLQVRVLRQGSPVAGVEVTVCADDLGRAASARTDERGLAMLSGLDPGRYSIAAQAAAREVVLVGDAVLSLDIDLGEARSTWPGLFGESVLARLELERVPRGETAWAVLETVVPVAVTDRIDVAGLESGTPALWSVRGTAWRQNRVLVDGIDVTDPAGGRALLQLDLGGFEQLALEDAARTARAVSAGAELDLVTGHPSASFSGSALFRYTGAALQADNRSAALLAQGVEPRAFSGFPSGRIAAGGGGFYGALSAFRLTSFIPGFPGEPESRLLSVLGKMERGRFALLGMAQGLDHTSYGAHPGASRDATTPASESSLLGQARYADGGWAASLGFARGVVDALSGSETSALLDLATGEVSASPPTSSRRVASRFDFSAARLQSWGPHVLRAGIEASRAEAQSVDNVPGGIHRLVVDGAPNAVALFTGSGETRTVAERLAVHAEDLVLTGRLRLEPGFRFDVSRSGRVHWTTVSGALRLQLALDRLGRGELQASLGRYPHVLTTDLAAAADPTALSTEWHRWSDANGDLQVSPAEIGSVLRRRGPAFTIVAADLPRPRTDEATFALTRRFGAAYVRLGGYHRWEKNLLQTVNVGIRPESYVSQVLFDAGPDDRPGTGDDTLLPYFDQRAQLGEDRFLLTHPPGLDAFSQGLDLTLAWRCGPFSATATGRAYRNVGRAGVGNSALENDLGVLGGLFEDPNEGVNADGRLFFDRAYTIKILGTLDAPRGFRFAAAARYWDGQPFARHVFLDLGQGFSVLQATARGETRFTYNMTVDVRGERRMRLGATSLAVAVDVFNLLNQALETGEDPRTGPTFRTTTSVQPGRTVLLEGCLRF